MNSFSSPTNLFTLYSTRRSIAPYLEKYDMIAERIPLRSFLHVSHRTDGCSYIENFNEIESNNGNKNKSRIKSHNSKSNCEKEIESEESVRIISVPTFDSMSLLKITKKMQGAQYNS